MWNWIADQYKNGCINYIYDVEQKYIDECTNYSANKIESNSFCCEYSNQNDVSDSVIAVRLLGGMLRVLHIVWNLMKSMKMATVGDYMPKLQMKHGIVVKSILIKFTSYVSRLQIYQRGSDKYINVFRMECILLRF